MMQPLLAALLLLLLTTHVAGAHANAILIRGGTVVNHDAAFPADVLVEGELIVAVAPGLSAPPGARVINATGLLVIPGGIEARGEP